MKVEPTAPTPPHTHTPVCQPGLLLLTFRLPLALWLGTASGPAAGHCLMKMAWPLRPSMLARCPWWGGCPWPASVCRSAQWLLVLWMHLRNPPWNCPQCPQNVPGVAFASSHQDLRWGSGVEQLEQSRQLTTGRKCPPGVTGYPGAWGCHAAHSAAAHWGWLVGTCKRFGGVCGRGSGFLLPPAAAGSSTLASGAFVSPPGGTPRTQGT